MTARIRRGAIVAVLAIPLMLLGACAGNRGNNINNGTPPPSPTPARKISTKPDAKQLKEAAVYNLQLAVDYYQHGNLSEAKEKLDRALGQDSQNANTHAFAGLLYDRLGEERQAEEHYSRAASLDPKNPDILNKYAVYLCRKGKAEKGRTLALQAAANPLYKTPDVAFVNAGICAQKLGKDDLAEASFRQALAARPRSPDALVQMANLEFARGQYLPARAFIERYFEAVQPDAPTLMLALRIERALGNSQAAGDYARRLKADFATSVETQQLLQADH